MFTILAIFGLVLAVLQYEYGHHLNAGAQSEVYDMDMYPDPMDHPLNSFSWTNPIRMVIAVSSLLAFYFLIVRHYYKRKWLNEFFASAHNRKTQGVPDLFRQYNDEITGRMVPDSSRSIFTWSFLIEVLILLIFPIPYYDFYITEVARKEILVIWFYSEWATALMWTRVYFLGRTLLSMSVYNDAYARKLCQFYGVDASARFTIKCFIN